jgi:MFS family permease
MYDRATSNRLLYTIFITQSLLSASQIAVFTLIAIVAVRLAGTESVAGLPSSTLTFSQALAAYPVALVMGRFGRRLGLTLGYALAALGGLLGVIAVLQSIFPLLLLSAILIGMGRAGTDQSRFVAGELFPEAERARMIGRIVFAGTIGAVAGPVLVAPSGRLMESVGLHPDIGPWLAMFVLTALASLITLFLLRPDPMAVAKNVSDSEETEGKTGFAGETRPLRALLMLPQVQLAILAVLVSQTVMVVLMVMTPLHMDHLHHTRDSISLVISAHTLGMFGLSAITGYLIDRFGRIRMLLVGSLLLISAAMLAPAFSDQYMLAVALFLLGLGWNFGYVSGSSLLASTLQGEERARVQGMNDSLVNLAAGFGSIGAGMLFATGGYGLVSIAGLILTLCLIVVILVLGRPQMQPQAEAEAV